MPLPSDRNRARRYWLLRFLAGLAVLLAAGGGLPGWLAAALFGEGNYRLADVLAGLGAFFVALRSVSPLVRSFGDDVRLRRDWGAEAHATFLRATTAQQVFQLLLAVAHGDGPPGPRERELVREFLRQRFPDPLTQAGLRTFETHGTPIRDLHALARSVARGLDHAERATLYSWSCLVALADGRFGAGERVALRQVARGLSIGEADARLLLLLAVELRRQFGGAAGRPRADGRAEGPAEGRWGPRSAAPPRVDGRAELRRRALETLDLPADASRESIRRRHRELVRRFHPDAQPHLGPVAQQEATQRFQQIQRAYEVLMR